MYISVTGNACMGAELIFAWDTVFDLTSRDRAQFKFDLTVNVEKIQTSIISHF